MAVQGNFAEIMDEVFCSPQAAWNQASLGGLIVDKLYNDVDLDKIFTLVPGVMTGDVAANLMYPAIYNAVQNSMSNDCSITACDVTPEYAAKQWTIMLAECRVPLCTKTLTPEFLAYWGKFKRLNPDDSEYDAVVDMVYNILYDVLKNTLLAKLWFSDTTFQAVPGTASSTIDGIDGFYAQVSSNADNKVTFVGAGDLTGKEIYDNVKAGIDKYKFSKYRKTLKQANIYIDEMDAERLAGWLNELKGQHPYDCTCIGLDGVMNAGAFTAENITIGGLKVIPQPFEEMMSQFDEYNWQNVGDPDVAMFDHFFLITPKEVLQVGTPNLEDLDGSKTLKQFYDNKDRTYYFDIGYIYGAMVANNHFVWGVREIANPYA